MIIGSHLSISKGFYKAGRTALEIGANSFQFFTRNPRGFKAKKLDLNDIKSFKELQKQGIISEILAHAPYTMNLCSANSDTAEFGRRVLNDDFVRMSNIPCSLYNFHPGSHVGQGIDVGIEKIIKALNHTITGDENFYILLETMSGKGTEVGSNFEEIQSIISSVNKNEKLGVCIDTCHLYSSGYDIVNDLDGVLNKFDKIIGIKRIKAVHINDSKTKFNSKKDRHEKIGFGTIGLETIKKIVNHRKLKNIPFILETPNELDGYKLEIEKIMN